MAIESKRKKNMAGCHCHSSEPQNCGSSGFVGLHHLGSTPPKVFHGWFHLKIGTPKMEDPGFGKKNHSFLGEPLVQLLRHHPRINMLHLKIIQLKRQIIFHPPSIFRWTNWFNFRGTTLELTCFTWKSSNWKGKSSSIHPPFLGEPIGSTSEAPP